MNKYLKEIGAGLATVISGAVLTLPPTGADAGVDLHVERSCLGNAFDVSCLVPPPPTTSIADCRPPSEQGKRSSTSQHDGLTSQRDGLTSHPAWC
jgi:hypothetical protein